MYKFMITGFVPKVGLVTEPINNYDAAKAIDAFRSKYSFSVLIISVVLVDHEKEITKLKTQLKLFTDEKVQNNTEQ